MNVKNRLKELDVKLSYFANALEMSRPTLNAYISTFEKNETLPNEKYQLIFEKLFNDSINSKDDFNRILYKYHNLINRDKVLGTIEFDTKSTDLITSILSRIKVDLQQEDFEESVYIFINMLIGSYRREPIFKKFAAYFLYLNSNNDLLQISDNEKIFISHCYKIMSLEKENKLTLDEEYYEKFKKRVKEIKDAVDKNKENKTKEIFKRNIENTLDLEIQEQLKLGVDIEDMDVEKIINKIGLIKKT
ncbi:hypothetical protein [Propionispira raffinosivorans]|uniref:hypothetical protein n=1 Tax=Propionispira raffinosivorans TaxID=86959 RepID=UPI0003769ACD|nr:hypothetical protein [Propionispira raffinosivorans]